MESSVIQILSFDADTHKKLVSVLTGAFWKDILFDYAFSGASENEKRIALDTYFGFALNWGVQRGQVFTVPDKQAVLIWLPQESFPPASPEPGSIVIDPVIVERFESHEHTPESIITDHGNNFGYLWLLAVDEASRGKGYARQLIETAVAQMAEAGKTECWLSTENIINKDFYIRHGFCIFTDKISDAGIRTTVFVKSLTP